MNLGIGVRALLAVANAGWPVVSTLREQLGGLPATLLGGIAVATLLAGAVVVARGFRAEPTSWGLVASGAGLLVLTYLLGAATIAAASQGAIGAAFGAHAPRLLTIAVVAVPAGFALHLPRMALRSWAREDPGSKVVAIVLLSAAIACVVAAVQIARGAPAPPPPAESESTESGGSESSEPAR